MYVGRRRAGRLRHYEPPIPGGGPGPGTGVITRANISYVGCFGLFSGSDAGAMTNSAGGTTARIRPSDGKLVFLVTREATPGGGEYWPVYEIEDPLSYSTDYTTAPRSANYPTAKYVGTIRGAPYLGLYMRSWFDGVIHPEFPAGTERPPSGGGWSLGGLYWNEDTQLLYWTYFDLYNTSGFADWGLGATHLDSFNSGTNSYTFTSYGPWRVKCTDGDLVAHYGPWRCLSLARHPFTGKMLCGSTIISGNAGCPWGPDLYGGADWPTASTPSGYGAPDIVMPDRYLEHYYMGGLITSDGHFSPPLRAFRRGVEASLWEPTVLPTTTRINPAFNGGVGSWTEIDSSSLGIWLELTNTRGVLFFGNVSGAVSQDPTNRDAGHEWYEVGLGPPTFTNSPCSHGHMPYLETQGPVSTHNFPFLCIYDPDDLELVKNTSADYTPEPVDFIDLELVYNIQTAPMTVQGFKNVGFTYWDASRNYLFVMALYADRAYAGHVGNDNGALMHVFHIADVA